MKNAEARKKVIVVFMPLKRELLQKRYSYRQKCLKGQPFFWINCPEFEEEFSICIHVCCDILIRRVEEKKADNL